MKYRHPFHDVLVSFAERRGIRMKQLIVSQTAKENVNPNKEVIDIAYLSKIARSGSIVRYLFHYSSVTLKCDSLETLAQPFLLGGACRLLTFGKCVFEDDEKNTVRVGIGTLLVWGARFLKESVNANKYLKKVNAKVDQLMDLSPESQIVDGRPMYLRCDLPYYYMAGGSIGHIAGVINNLEDTTGTAPVFVTAREVPTVNPSIKRDYISPKVAYKNVGDVMSIAFNENIEKTLAKYNNQDISFVYQRSALNAYAGVEFALKKKIPYVLEYNGSEIWIAKHWGNRDILGLALSEKIEKLTFEKATLITCVSKPLKQQLIEMGIDERKIIVTPNGVNTDMYNPGIDGSEIRKKYGIPESDVVIGFIGTFGAWHGAEILAEAYGRLAEEQPGIHLLMIGDGLKMPEVREIIKKHHVEDSTTLTGMVPQTEGAKYLAACDVLVSPTIMNPDGTPFFGSPTKMFEYMAMGKAIIASDMDQMAEILDNRKSALLTAPGDIKALINALSELTDNKSLREKLGERAREVVCREYTWEKHVKKIYQALLDLQIS